MIYNRYRSFPGRKKLPGGFTPDRVLTVPIIRQERVVAILVTGYKPLDYTESDVQFASYFADIAWTIAEFKQSEEKIRYISFHDILTGLYNRAFIEEEMHRLDTDRQLPISIIVADLNGLKLVNDTYGHSVGDQMLRIVADILKKSCRKDDIIARWGGDEFLVLLPRTSGDKVQTIFKRIRKKCRDAYIGDVPVSLALGCAVKDHPAISLSDTIKKAEDYMYKRKLADSKSTKSAVLNALLKTLGAKSYETEEHSCRMQMMALEFGEKLGLPDSELDRLSLLITLHDIGKISISEEILTRAGPLTEDEWKIIKKHPETGFRIARSTGEFAHIAEDILSHHERWDGRGYPRGLKGEQIPFLARITSIVDAFEVMTRGRPYKDKLSVKEAIEELSRCSGTQFDPELARLFIENVV
ncbi:MAG: diguanylate cyclase [Firmicutes bacterium]|nr:diguanylate cyclase [Bacillota bacterium]